MDYGRDYIDKTLRLNSRTAQSISDIRWGFLRQTKIPLDQVLDFGSGVGWFKAFAPEDVSVDTYDINPVLSSLITGIKHARYSVVTLWDVFEHISDYGFLQEVLKMTNYAAFSVPVLPKGQNLLTWKHYKPGEHLHQFTPESLEAIWSDWGFAKHLDGWPECEIRQDIYSAVYRRKV